MRVEVSFSADIAYGVVQAVRLHVRQILADGRDPCGCVSLCHLPNNLQVLETIPKDLKDLHVQWGSSERDWRVIDMVRADVDEEPWDLTSEPWAQQLCKDLQAWASGGPCLKSPR